MKITLKNLLFIVQHTHMDHLKSVFFEEKMYARFEFNM